MIRVAVLLTCHNRKNKTLACLNSLLGQGGLNEKYLLEIYLLDDKSTDGTGVAVKLAYPHVKVIEGNGNLYWNRGMHTVWKLAAAENPDFYLWLNDDTNLYENALLELIFEAELTDFKSIICGSIESPFTKGELTYGGGTLNRNRYFSNYPDGSIRQCEIINGNCVLVPRYVFDRVGNLDWQFIHAIGDHDYSLRAKKLGVISYSTGNFVASCPKNESLPKWCLPHVNIIDRIKNLYSPLGYCHPYYQFVFEKRHFGWLTACFHYLSIHLRALIPGLWK